MNPSRNLFAALLVGCLGLMQGCAGGGDDTTGGSTGGTGGGTGSDTTSPTVAITSPSAGGTYTTTASSVAVTGTAADSVGVQSVTWSNNRGGSGSASGTNAWTISAVSLMSGSNTITVMATDAAGNHGQATLTVTYNPVTPPTDVTAPVVTITSPMNSGSYSTSSATLNLSGAATDSVGVTSVTWSNNQGGSGTATGTGSWSVTGVSLQAGVNVITVTARDAANNSGTKTLSVTYTPSDTIVPVVTITSPTSSSTYPTSSATLNLSGAATDNVGVTSVTWSNSQGGSGTATGTGSWSVTGVALQAGSNVITVTAKDAANNSGTKTLTVTYTPSDAIAPVVTITSPTSSATYSTSTATLNLGGTATDAVGVTSVTWSNNRGGSGTATGTTSWSVAGVSLVSGVNVITISAKDAANNTGTKTISVTYTVATGGNDTTPPTLSISTPTTIAGTYASSSASVTLMGMAADNVSVTNVTWTRKTSDHSIADLSGVAVGTASWSTGAIALVPGQNVITIRARDAAGNRVASIVLVNYSTTGSSRTIYVSANSGSDSNNGLSSAASFKTIARAINIVQPSDTIEVAAGTYDGSLLITKPGLANAGITLRAKAGDEYQAILRGSNASPTIYFYHNDCDEDTVNNSSNATGNTDCHAFYWTVMGLKVMGSASGGGDGNAIKIDPPKVNIINNKICCAAVDVVKLVRTSNDILIQGNEIWQDRNVTSIPSNSDGETNAQGVDMVGADRVHVIDNYVHDMPDIGIYAKGNSRNILFEGNRLVNIGANAIMLGQDTDEDRLLDGNYETYDSIARNNLVINAGWACLATSSSKNVKFYNNSCYNTGTSSHGAVLLSNESEIGQSASGVEFVNNILHVAAGRPIFKFATGVGDAPSVADYHTLKIANNIYYVSNGSVPTFSWDDGGMSSGDFAAWLVRYTLNSSLTDTSTVVDPKYLDLSFLTLQSSSLAIDAGQNSSTTVPKDISGTSRPQGGTTDIGAYEY